MKTKPHDQDPEEASESQDQATGESMESLLAQQDTMAKRLSGNEVVWVKVISVTADQVLVDIGEKNEGTVPLSEFLEAIAADEEGAAARGGPAPGQRIPVVRVGSRKDGVALLSHRKARAHLGWDAVLKAFKEKARVRGQVRSAIKGGFLVDISGVSGFLPASLADLRPVREPQKMVGTGVRCYILEVNEAKRQIVLSRKAVLLEEAGKRKEKLLSEVKVGQARIGRVVHASPAGLVVDIGGAEGFVKAADAAWGKPAAPPNKRGDKVRVKVLSLPAAPEERIGLGIKQLLANPGDAIKKRWPPKTVVKGKVSEAGATGVRFQVGEKQGAFCPPHECEPEAPVKAGDEVSAVVLGVDPESFDLLVSIKRFEEIKDRKRMAQYLKAPKPLTLGEVLSPEGREG